MKFAHTTIFVNDMDKSVKFYNDLIGLEVKNTIEMPGMKLVFLGEGDTLVELAWNGEKVENNERQTISMGFVAENLETAVEKIVKAGYQTVTEVIAPNPTVKFQFLLDPDGYQVQILQYI